jgi:hypothetical protein
LLEYKDLNYIRNFFFLKAIAAKKANISHKKIYKKKRKMGHGIVIEPNDNKTHNTTAK